VFSNKKREDHAEYEGKGNDEIDFAWIVFIGMKIGYTEKEISRMYYGKWYEMFQHFKWYHNFTVKKYLFKEPEKEVSLMDL